MIQRVAQKIGHLKDLTLIVVIQEMKKRKRMMEKRMKIPFLKKEKVKKVRDKKDFGMILLMFQEVSIPLETFVQMHLKYSFNLFFFDCFFVSFKLNIIFLFSFFFSIKIR